MMGGRIEVKWILPAECRPPREGGNWLTSVNHA